ncbi:hypothetical protein N7456_006363 [Penicillium angulare]|uniref:Uncharacterized protein n=1 Tax=Penicillium angulare TaxID=116970 RepID=A0A9W9FHL7_9EURO|nr:hypothetical protein N7456_006363 [Penicillium angulare]
MQSHTNEAKFPDRTRTRDPVIPAPDKSPIDAPELPEYKSKFPTQSWEPNLDRRQSWSSEDRKHMMQERLLDIPEGKERGFSESGHGD